MNPPTVKPGAIERFHLALLQVLPSYLDPSSYVVKGGANLRLFLGSVRRSEAIDLDFVGRAAWQISGRLGNALDSGALASIVRVAGIRLNNVRAVKQTKTTQRWRMTLTAPGIEAPTKVELSLRDARSDDYQLDPVLQDIAGAAGSRRATANHYSPVAALVQKVWALRDRTEPQARDIFDIDFLRTRWPQLVRPGLVDPATIELARKRVFELTFDDYRSLVLEFLEPDFVSHYQSESMWEKMLLDVDAALEHMR